MKVCFTIRRGQRLALIEISEELLIEGQAYWPLVEKPELNKVS